MRKSSSLFVIVLVLCLLGLSPTAGARTGPAATYEVIDLGLGEAVAVNDRGEIVGSIGSAASSHAVVWRADAAIVDLHEAAGWSAEAWSNAYGINDHGEIVAMVSEYVPSSPPDSQTYYVDWDRRTSAVELWGITTELSPGDINDRGAVVGGEMGGAYLWTVRDGRVQLVDDGVANAVRVNNHGQVLGATSSFFAPEFPSGLHYVIRERDGSLTLVASFDMSFPPSVTPTLGDINNRGQVVYTEHLVGAPMTIGYLWDPKAGVATYDGVILNAINDHGLMAGSKWLSGSQYPVVLDEAGTFVELPAPEGWSGRGSAMDLNNKGVVVGRLDAPDGTHAVAWVPSK